MATAKPTAEKSQRLVGRSPEMEQIQACVLAGKNVLIEGPVGVGKTHLALSAVHGLKRPVFRVDGDSRYSEQKLAGWFDPPTALKKGFSKESFLAGPLVEAMQKGGVLFINELNRLPEGVQNVLLPAIDERLIVLPRIGEIRAKPGFLVVATQNPKEFVATSHLSEAILDRFEWIFLNYQTEEEERQIVTAKLKGREAEVLARASVRIARFTREHPRVRRGASVRAALSIAELAEAFLETGKKVRDAFSAAVKLALPTRIELEREGDVDPHSQKELQELLAEWTQQAFSQWDDAGSKKKS